MHASIGQLSSGKFYAFLHGFAAEPTVRDNAEAIEAMIRGEAEPEFVVVAPVAFVVPAAQKTFTVTLTFQHPAWNMVDGIQFLDIRANSKAEANAEARHMADRDGHLGWGQGRATFTAIED